MDFLADDELTLNQEDPRFKPKSERGGFSDGALGISRQAVYRYLKAGK